MSFELASSMWRALFVMLTAGLFVAGAADPVRPVDTNRDAPPQIRPATLASLVLSNLAGAPVHPLTNDQRVATVFFFIMHECPVANSYAPEIQRILTEYSPHGVRGHVIYVESDLTEAQTRIHAREYGYQPDEAGVINPLRDPRHQLVRLAGATVSPEAVVMSPAGEVLYRGRIDDRVADFGKRRVQPTRRDLRLALDAIVAGQPVRTRQTKAIGCYIPDDHADGAGPKSK